MKEYYTTTKWKEFLKNSDRSIIHVIESDLYGF